MKTIPIPTDQIPASARPVLKGFYQNLDAQFTADRIEVYKRLQIFDILNTWCEGQNAAQAKLTPIPAVDLPANVRPIVKTFHQDLQAVYTPLAAAQKTDVITCLEHWCTANTKALTETAGKGAGA